jgi:hypothetical protein
MFARRNRDRSNDGVVARIGAICSDAKAVPSCRAIFLMASPLLAVLLFGLLRMRLIKEASKRAVHAFACRDEPMPLVFYCSPDAKCRIVLVLGLRPGRTPLDICSRCNLALANLLQCSGKLSMLGSKIKNVPFTSPAFKNVNESPIVGTKPLRRTGSKWPLRLAVDRF